MKHSQKKKIDWSQFLSNISAEDYIFQNIPYDDQIKQASALITQKLDNSHSNKWTDYAL